MPITVDKDRVYYPEGGRLYISKGKNGGRTSPRRVVGVDLKAPRICGSRCVATSKSGSRCRRKTCQDYRYCPQHLAINKHLLIGKSKRLHQLGVDGMGLYAYDPSLGTLLKDATGYPVREMGKVVFRKPPTNATIKKLKDYIIGDYGGERMSRQEFIERYGDPNNVETAAYAEGGTGFILDGLAAASAVSYSNEPLDIAKLMRDSGGSRAVFVNSYNKAAEKDKKKNAMTRQIDKTIRMIPTRVIRQGEEILWHYGPGYWGTEGMKRVITGTGWSE